MTPQRTAAARRRRIDRALGLRVEGLVMKFCDCCPRQFPLHQLSVRGWCPECEREFLRVRAALLRRA